MSRQPAEAPAIEIFRLREFADGATSSNQLINKKLGLARPVEFTQDMIERTHQNLIRSVPHDSIFPDVERIMNEVDWEDSYEKSNAYKLARGI